MPQKWQSEPRRVWKGRSDVEKIPSWIADNGMCDEPIEPWPLLADEPHSHGPVLRPILDPYVHILVAVGRLRSPVFKGHLERLNGLRFHAESCAKGREVGVIADQDARWLRFRVLHHTLILQGEAPGFGIYQDESGGSQAAGRTERCGPREDTLLRSPAGATQIARLPASRRRPRSVLLPVVSTCPFCSMPTRPDLGSSPST